MAEAFGLRLNPGKLSTYLLPTDDALYVHDVLLDKGFLRVYVTDSSIEGKSYLTSPVHPSGVDKVIWERNHKRRLREEERARRQNRRTLYRSD